MTKNKTKQNKTKQNKTKQNKKKRNTKTKKRKKEKGEKAIGGEALKCIIASQCDDHLSAVLGKDVLCCDRGRGVADACARTGLGIVLVQDARMHRKRRIASAPG
jgi:hypothetical protein